MPEKPVFAQIMDDIREQIADGRLRPGDKLPSTAELQVAYECSDNPVKKAIGRLQAIGLLVGRQGRGVYVTDGRSGPETR